MGQFFGAIFVGGITLCKLSVQTSENFMAICRHKITAFSLLDPDVIYQRFSVQVLLRIYLGRNHA